MSTVYMDSYINNNNIRNSIKVQEDVCFSHCCLHMWPAEPSPQDPQSSVFLSTGALSPREAEGCWGTQGTCSDLVSLNSAFSFLKTHFCGFDKFIE